MSAAVQNGASKPTAKAPTTEDLNLQIEMLKKDISALTSTIKDLGKSEAERAVRSAKAKGEEFKQAGEDQMELMKLRAEAYGQEAGEFVRKQPAMALGLAAALGLVAGMIMSGRR